MKILEINIMINEPYGRFGEVEIYNKKYISVEREYNNNIPFQSAIPLGLYELLPHSSEKYPDTFAMVNPELDVYHLPEHRPNNKGRYACVLHSGNYPDDFLGCQGYGNWWLSDRKRNRLGAGLSAHPTEIIKQYIRDEGITHLLIKMKYTPEEKSKIEESETEIVRTEPSSVGNDLFSQILMFLKQLWRKIYV